MKTHDSQYCRTETYSQWSHCCPGQAAAWRTYCIHSFMCVTAWYVYAPPGPLLLGLTGPLISLSPLWAFIFIFLNACVCAYVRAHPAISLRQLLLNKHCLLPNRAGRAPRAWTLTVSTYTCMHSRTHGCRRYITYVRRHILKGRALTGISFMSCDHLAVIHEDPSRIRHESEACLSDNSIKKVEMVLHP